MKNRKTPFIWVVVIVALGGFAYVTNVKQENPTTDAPPQPQAPAQAPSTSQLGNAVASTMKKGSKASSPAAQHQHIPGTRAMIEKPEGQRAAVKTKPDLSTQTLGQWYHSDSVKTATK